MSRLLDFYLATAAGVYALERPGDQLVQHLATTQYPGLRFTQGAEALDWLYSEAASLLACVRQAVGTARLSRAVDLLWAAKDLTESGANSRQYEATAVAVCDASQVAQDIRAEGRARTTLTNVLLVSGRIQQAAAEARLAMDRAATAKDVAACSWAANDMGLICLHQQRYEDGKFFFDQAIRDFTAAGNRAGEATTLFNLSRAHLAMGNVAMAVEISQNGLTLLAELGRTMRLANGHYALGMALTKANRHTEALSQFQDAVTIFVDHRQRLWEGITHFRIAEAQQAARRPAQAAQHAEQALAIGCIGGDQMRGNVLTLLGRALSMLGQVDRAQACWHEAVKLYEATGASGVDEVRALLRPAEAA
jgi:tetratricopeptide (TPR) repeat protein